MSNRSEGLTKRNVPKKKDETSTEGASVDWGDWDHVDDSELKDEDEHESKEMKLTLMEEVLLLGLKDREVYSCYCANFLFEFRPR